MKKKRTGEISYYESKIRLLNTPNLDPGLLKLVLGCTLRKSGTFRSANMSILYQAMQKVLREKNRPYPERTSCGSTWYLACSFGFIA